MLNNRILPMSLHSSALSVKNFCNALHEFGQSKIDDLANDLWSAYDISTCNDCGEYDFYDDQISCYEGDFHVCQNCCDDNYSYSDYRGTYVHYEDYDEDENHGGQDSNGVYDYCHRVEDDLDFHTFSRLSKTHYVKGRFKKGLIKNMITNSMKHMDWKTTELNQVQ